MQDNVKARVSVAVDAMGGDNAPVAVVEGAVDAALLHPDADIHLVGDKDKLEPLLKSYAVVPANIIIDHAPQVIDMSDSPTAVIRKKADSSISVAMCLVRDGKAQAVISAGNSGAVMAASMFILKPLTGVERPAIATPLPSKQGISYLLDAGATTDCKPVNLVQFAYLGAAYAQAIMNKPNVTIGLLSIGEEPSKGDELTKETHKILAKCQNINFIGNVEPKELTRGEVDVVVCDGFAGNLILKTGEAMGELIMGLIKSKIGNNMFYKLGALMIKPALRHVKKMFDYAEYGGALLLGVNGLVLIGHGRSNARAIRNAISTAVRAARSGAAIPSFVPTSQQVSEISENI